MAVLAVSTGQADTIYVDVNCPGPGPGDGSELDPFCSIQTAIDNAVDTDEIIVAPGPTSPRFGTKDGRGLWGTAPTLT